MKNLQQKAIHVPARYATMLFLALALAACSDDGLEGSKVENLPAPQSTNAEQISKPLHVTQVRRISVEKFVFASGTIAAKQTSNIGPLVEGVIEKIFVKVGDRVKSGDPLFQTRKVDYVRSLEEAKSAMTLANILGVQAERNYDRARELAGQRHISQARLDDIETANQIAVAKIQQAKVVLETAEQRLMDTVVRAPFDGAITGRNVDEGVYLSNRFSMGGGSAVVRIQELAIVSAIVQTPEKNLNLLTINQPAIVTIQGHEEVHDSFVYVLNDLVNPQTRTVELRLPIKNKNYRIKPGQFAEAKILLPKYEAFVIPKNAMTGRAKNPSVFVARDNVAIQLDIQTREHNAEQIEVTSGLTEQDIVIINPPDTLKNGDELGQLIVMGES
jgi:RND family efflux transporter MFP subunit